MAEKLGLEWSGAVEVSTGLCGGALVSIECSGDGTQRRHFRPTPSGKNEPIEIGGDRYTTMMKIFGDIQLCMLL